LSFAIFEKYKVLKISLNASFKVKVVGDTARKVQTRSRMLGCDERVIILNNR